MKKIIIIFTFILAAFCTKGQLPERFTYAAAIGTGFSMNEPAYTPFIAQVLGYYCVSERFSAGVGTGLSVYETTLIPLFADAKFALTRVNKFVPYVECGGGYAFAANSKANGGFYLNPSLGVQYALSGKMKLHLAAGYEYQQSERLKEYSNDYFTVNFVEKLNRHSISVKVGVLF